MYVAIYTPTEDCYMRFVGNITSAQNLCIIVETKEQTDYYISTQYVNSDYAGWDQYSEIFYAQKGHTYEFRVLGFSNARILKYGFK